LARVSEHRGGVTSRTKDAGIESLRAIAVVLMVAGHVIGTRATEGLTVPADSGWRFFYLALEDLRMPLFTVLSGFVYAFRPVSSTDGVGSLITGKVRRLLIPFVVVCTVFFFVRMISPGVNNRPELSELPAAYLYGYQHLWFLQAIFLVFVVVGSMDSLALLDRAGTWALFTGTAIAVFVLVHLPADAAVFSLNGFIRLLPFFLLGYGAHRHAATLLRRGVLLATAVVFVPVYALRLYVLAADVDLPAELSRALSALVALLSLVGVLGIRRHLASRVLGWLGGFSFGIYLLHVFGTAAARVVATHLGLNSTTALFTLGLAAGVIAPIAFELALGRYRLISWAVLGQKSRRRPSRPESAPTTGNSSPIR
jgi:peptidoglycan/LPS O-acetylase OafA/YrhL